MPVQVKNVASVNMKPKLNYPARKNIKFHVLRNGVPSFKGICFPFKITSSTSFTQLLSEISIALKYKVFINNGGVQCLYSTDGTEITSIEQLVDGQTYVATCVNEKFKDDHYQITSRPTTAKSRLSVKQSSTLTRTVTPKTDLVTEPENKGRRCMSLVSQTKTGSQKPSNIKLDFGKSAGNIQPKSGKSLADVPAKNRKLKLIRLGAPKDGNPIEPITPGTGSSARRSLSVSGTRAVAPVASVVTRRSFSMSASNALSNSSVSCRTPSCDKTNSARRPPDKTTTKPRVSASATPVSPSTNSRQAFKMSTSKVSTSGPRGNTALAKSDVKPTVKRTIPTTSSVSINRRSESINRRSDSVNRRSDSVNRRAISASTQAQSCTKIQHRWITVVRHGIKPRASYRILLNHNTPNFESIMNKISGTMKFSSEAKVFFETCIVANRYEDFFNSHFIFFAFPNMSVQWEDFDMHPKEEEEIERLNRISMLRHEITSVDVPKCISSKYDIRKTISYGCFSLLVQCTDKSTKSNLALKIVRKVHGNEVMEANLNKNKIELDFLSILSNSNILQVFFQHETVDALYFIVDYFNGGDLHKLIESAPRILEKEAWNFIGDIMSALRYLHGANIVHRDVSATNLMIFINREGGRQLKLCDFGVAARVTEVPLTDVVGFLLYMAPEMIKRKGYGCKVDVWGAGITLYYILAQTLPFLTESVDESRRRILSPTEVSFKGAEWDEVSDSMKSLISAMLIRNEQRRLTAAEAYDVIYGTPIETDGYVPTEEDQNTVRNSDTRLLRESSLGEMKKSDIVTSEEPENINYFSFGKKKVNSSHSIIDVITLSDKISEYNSKRSNTSELGRKSSNFSAELSCKKSGVESAILKKSSGVWSDPESKRSDIKPGVIEKRRNTKSEVNAKSSELNPEIQRKRSEGRQGLSRNLSDTRSTHRCKSNEGKPEIKSKRSDIRPEVTGRQSNSKPELKGKCSETIPDLQMKRSEEKPDVTVKVSKDKTAPESKNSGTNEQLPSKQSKTKPDIKAQLSDTTQELQAKTSEVKPILKSYCNDTTPELQRKYSNVMHELKIKCTGSNTTVTERCSDTEEGLTNKKSDIEPELQVRCSNISPDLETKCGLKLEREKNDAEPELEFDSNEITSAVDVIASDITQRTFSIESGIGQDNDCKQVSSIEALDTVRSATFQEYDKVLNDDDSDIQSEQNDTATEIQTVQNVLKPELCTNISDTIAKTTSQGGEVTQDLQSDKSVPEIQISSSVISRELKDKRSNSTDDQSKSNGPTPEVNTLPDDNCSVHSDTDMSNVSGESPTISTVPSDHNEYYSCPGYEKEDTDNSETEIQAFALDNGLDNEHNAVNKELITQKAEDVKNQIDKEENMEAIVFQGFGDEMSHHSILIQVGDHDSDEYKSSEASEVCPGTVVDEEVVEEVRTRGFQILQHIQSGEFGGQRQTGRYDESPYF